MSEIGPVSPARLREILSEVLTTTGPATEATLSSILARLNVDLDTRASEDTLSAIRAQTDRLQFDASNFLRTVVQNFPTDYFKAGESIGESPLNLTKVGGTAQTGRDWSSDLSKLQTMAAEVRWGRNVAPAWVHAAEVTAPGAGSNIVSKIVGASPLKGYIYGFLITAGEANDFKINWISGGAAYSIRITFGGKGTVCYTDTVPLNEGLPADSATSITIQNVNAGGAGVVYQAMLLYGEV